MTYDEVIHLKKVGGGGSGGTRGSITGTLSDQTDLQTELDSKLDVTSLSSNITLYATTTASVISGYNKLVTSISDPDYDEPAIDVSTGAITGVGQIVGQLVSEPGLFVGNPGIINITTIGQIRKTSGGASNAEFYFKVFHRTSAGVETEIAVSNYTGAITTTVYAQFNTGAILNNGDFLATDRVVIKFYADKIGGGINPVYDFQFGGDTPVRTLLPIPATLILTDYYTKTETDGLLDTKENIITAGTVGQYYRGDKTFQTLDKSVVGLGNVDNTTDLNKPISTATQTALNTKQATLISGTNIKTINGNSLLGSGDLAISGGGSGRGLTGNAGTNPATNFIGTTDAQPLVVKTNNVNRAIINSIGNMGIGTISPTSKLHVAGDGTQGELLVTTSSNFISISIASLLAPNATGDTYFAVGKSLSGAGTALIGYSVFGAITPYAFLTTYGRPASDFAVSSNGNVGIGTVSPASKLTVNGDIEITDATKGVILKSPNGTRWRITVDNTGALTTTAL